MRISIKNRSFDHLSLQSLVHKKSYITLARSQTDAPPKPNATNARPNARPGQAAADRDLVLDVLSSTATKRDARIYLSRFDPTKKPEVKPSAARPEPSQKTGVNLGSLFQTPHAVNTSPQFRQYPRQDVIADPTKSPLHIAVLVIRSTSSIEDTVLEGVGHTVAQLSRLGLSCMVIVDDDVSKLDLHATQSLLNQVDRIVAAIEKEDTVRARRLDGMFYHKGHKDPNAVGVQLLKPIHLYEAFARNFVTVTAPLVYNEEERLVGVNASGATLALARALLDGSVKQRQSEKVSVPKELAHPQQELSLDRVIILDPRGGIPQVTLGGSHVFVNLEQEFAPVSQELQGLLDRNTQITGSDSAKTTDGNATIATAAASLTPFEIHGHLSNLQLARGTLAMLPSTSSALITTPQAAAYSAVLPSSPSPGPSVGTRSQRNPLIHNLLTDKPLFSSSLPRQRLSTSSTSSTPTNDPCLHHAPPTHLKHGMPVSIIPDPVSNPWHPPSEIGITNSISLDDPRISLPRLTHLIEDSFGRPLDRESYFARIRPILAGVIIAGDYEGGAILTWESPPDSPSSPPVPYLDKFAVLKRSQGAGGVADVVFSAMVRRCFPDGVCWRSRRGNPVNKWYFERSVGTYKLPVGEEGAQGWTMFWTTEGLGSEEFADYAGVCAGIGGCWADGKKVLD